MYEVVCVEPGDTRFGEVVAHMKRTDDWRHVRSNGQLRKGMMVIAALCGERAVGHISLRKQRIEIPADPPVSLYRGDEVLWESFVWTFSVEEPWRRRGLGTALQQEALELSRGLGCWQMRSWSSSNRNANHRLKTALGFCAVPTTQNVEGTGERIPGVYFVMKL